MDKRDEKYVIQVMKNIEMEIGERVIRNATNDRAVIFLAGGELIAFKEDVNTVYTEGAILGIEQFLFNKPWTEDIICQTQATICKLTFDDVTDLAMNNAIAASRLHKRIVRQYCYSQIYLKKKDNMHFFSFRGVQDD